MKYEGTFDQMLSGQIAGINALLDDIEDRYGVVRFSRKDAEDELLHAGREVVEPSKEAVQREAGGLREVFDRHELGTLVHNRETREAPDRVVDLLELSRGQLLAALF